MLGTFPGHQITTGESGSSNGLITEAGEGGLTLQVLQSFGKPHADRASAGPTHIFNLGHGISQFTPPDHVAALVAAVHSQSRALRT